MARFGIDEGSVGGRRDSAVDPDGHPAGRALDFMVDRATGDQLSTYVLANQARLGVTYVIWRQRYNDGSGWDVMDDRGGVTANHFDHVHLSFDASNPAAAGLPC